MCQSKINKTFFSISSCCNVLLLCQTLNLILTINQHLENSWLAYNKIYGKYLLKYIFKDSLFKHKRIVKIGYVVFYFR